MKVVDSISTAPITVPQTVRGREIRALTSCRAGKIVPLWCQVLLREDRVSLGNLQITLDMAETVHPLLNAVGVTLQAHFVPFSAFQRFSGMDGFNKSYAGVKDREADAAPVPFFQTVNFAKADPFWKTLGLHAVEGSPVNSAYLEAYNVLVNWLRGMRSKTLAQRLLNDTSLAQAFWNHPFLWHIKPDFDQAMIDGDIPLSLSASLPLTASTVPVTGLGIKGTGLTGAASTSFRQTGGLTGVSLTGVATSDITNNLLGIKTTGSGSSQVPDLRADLAGVFAELQDADVVVSLASIEQAKQTKAFAVMRERYKGLSDEHLMDLLMSGIRVPDEDLRQPILLAKVNTIFGMTERHAMDGASLDQSVTVGKTSVNLRFRTPPMNTGGIIIVTAQIVPEQLFERMADHFLGITEVSALPEFIRDYLDPEKVEVVHNNFVDVLHSTPTGVFGYAPLNHAWKGTETRIGGKFYRPVPDAFVEDRQRFWSVETLNPALNSSFYLVPADLPHSVFADTLADPFEITTLGGVQIVGNTQFGQVFEEADGNYEAVAEKVDNDRIVLP